MARSLYNDANTSRILCSTSSMPITLRKVSCWPANDASGKSSAVADERTANDAPGLSAVSLSNSARIAASTAGGNGVRSTHERICAPASASARTSSVFSVDKRSLIFAASPSCLRNSRKACAVVAKPPGTRTPEAASCEIISPRLAFLPPTASTSVILRFSKGTTRAVGSKRVDMGKLRDDEKPGPSPRPAQQQSTRLSILGGGWQRAWGEMSRGFGPYSTARLYHDAVVRSRPWRAPCP